MTSILINGLEFVPNRDYFVITETFDLEFGKISQIKYEKSGIFVIISEQKKDGSYSYQKQIRLAEGTGIYTDFLDASIDLHQSIINKV